MHCYKMEVTVIENSESKIKSESEVKSKRKPPPGGIKTVRRFKRGHPYWGPQNAATSETRQTNRSMWLRRLNMDEYSRVVHVTPGGLLTVPDADGVCGNSKILRPRPDKCPDLTDSYLQTEETDGVSEMRLLNMQKNVAMWNECFTEHATNTTCISPQLEVHNERQVGLCWKMSLHCLHCEYQSGMHKLYTEVDTGSCGQKPATSNVALHVGLQDSTMGITKMRHILAATNTPPPSRCGLQRNADKVAAITAQATMHDLRKESKQKRLTLCVVCQKMSRSTEAWM